jgi:hypothetical protein
MSHRIVVQVQALLALAGALALAVPAAAAGDRCVSGTYQVRETPFVPGSADATRDVILMRDGEISIAGCAPATAKVRTGATRVVVSRRWDSCAGITGPVSLRFNLDLDCQKAKGVVRFGDAAMGVTKKRFKATSVAPKPQVAVDPAVIADLDAIPPANGALGAVGEPPRTVEAMVDEGAQAQMQFVAEELIVYTDDMQALEAFLARWNATLVRTVSPADYGLPGIVSQHLVRIDASRADASRLVADLKSLNPEREVKLRASSERALATLAAEAQESVRGAAVALNLVGEASTYENRSVNEGAGFGNAFTQPTLRGDCAIQSGACASSGVALLRYGVTEAWRALDRAGRLGNRVLVGVLDGGFSNVNTNLPAGWQHLSPGPMFNLEQPSTVLCGGVACPFHGTNVAQVATAVANDGAGIAGTGGPVADLVTTSWNGDMFSTTEGVLRLFRAGARVINMSIGITRTGSYMDDDDAERFNDVTRAVFGQGVLLLAAAGNNGAYVDSKFCGIFGCHEDVAYFPCENDGVMCVGGLDAVGNKHPSSNYGAEVEMYAPYTVVGGPAPGAAIGSINGTSFSSPYVAGVAALILAANPNLRGNDVHNILTETGRPSSDKDVARYVDAYAAVIRALGGTPPELQSVGATQVSNGALFGSPVFELSAVVSDPDAGEAVNVEWSSNRDGALGTGNPRRLSLTRGAHRLSATAVDAKGFRSRTLTVDVNVEYNTSKPEITILSPRYWAEYKPTQAIVFELTGIDWTAAGNKIVPGNVTWYSNLDGYLGAGSRINARLTSYGVHAITAYYSYDFNQQWVYQTVGVYITDLPYGSVYDTAPTMIITKPADNDVIVYANEYGVARLELQGYGYDAEDIPHVLWGERPFSLYWYTSTGKQYFIQSGTIELQYDMARYPNAKLVEIGLYGIDSRGNEGESPKLRVWVLPSTLR